jgi:hypothetical protein
MYIKEQVSYILPDDGSRASFRNSVLFNQNGMLKNVLHMCRSDGLKQRFSIGGPQEVARCSVNIMKVYLKNERSPICVEIFITSMIFYFYS